MTGSDHVRHWVEMLKAEIARRRAAKLEAAGGDARKRLYRELDLMHERIRAAPGYVEQDPATRAEQLRELDRWFAEHYGTG